MTHGAIKDSHYPRKIFHALAGAVIPSAYYLEILPREALTGLVLTSAAAWIGFDSLRLRNASLNERFARALRPLLKRKETHALTGASYLLGGASMAILLYPTAVMMTTLFFIALGDPAAAVIGKRFGRTRFHNGRSLEGSLAMFAICLFVARWLGGFTWSVSAAGAMIAAVTELYSGNIDDNITVPLLSGAALVALS
jgi:dolichol kinase